jgi:AmmeMemoRadiSam system protein A
MERFSFSLTEEQKASLKELVWRRILDRLNNRDSGIPEPPSDILREPFGAFVTLKRKGNLRGCIGHIVGDRPLWRNVAEMALAAAFEDPRFPPLGRAELDGLEVEITVLSPWPPVPIRNASRSAATAFSSAGACIRGCFFPRCRWSGAGTG